MKLIQRALFQLSLPMSLFLLPVSHVIGDHGEAEKSGGFLGKIVVRSDDLYNETGASLRVERALPEGTRLNIGDEICRFDVSNLERQRLQQKNVVRNAKKELLTATESLAIETRNGEKRISAAQLESELAALDLKHYRETTFPFQESQLSQQVNVSHERLFAAEERMNALTESMRDGGEQEPDKDNPETEGNEGQPELDDPNLSEEERLLSIQLLIRKNKLANAEERYRILTAFEGKRKSTELEAHVLKSKRNLDRVKLNAKSNIKIYEAQVEAAEENFGFAEQKLAQIEKQMTACVVKARREGILIYSNKAFDRGTVCVPNTLFARIIDLTTLQVKTEVDEASLRNLKVGQNAIVSAGEFNGRRLKATIREIGALSEPLEKRSRVQFHRDLNTAAVVLDFAIDDFIPRPGIECRVHFVDESD